MWDDLLTLAVGAVFVPVIVVLGLFRLAALKRAENLPPHAVEWMSQDSRTPK